MKAPAKVINAVLDNRGEAVITLSRTVTGISKSSCKLFLAGADGIIGNGDDVRKPAQVIYNPESFRVTIKGKLPANTPYRIRMDAKMIKALDGRKLDGEFTGKFPTGNGVTGGNFAVQVKTLTDKVRMSTREGIITLRIRPDVAPNTVANFLKYVNAGRFDNIFWTRSENNPAPFVIQGGGLVITGAGTSPSDVVPVVTFPPVADENDSPNALSNTIGTLAFAKGGPDDATDQFFINLADNSGLDSPSRADGGFTPFAVIISGLNVAQAINQKPTADLNTQIGTAGAAAKAGVDNVPVESKAIAEASFNPFRDSQFVRRIGQVYKNEVLA